VDFPQTVDWHNLAPLLKSKPLATPLLILVPAPIFRISIFGFVVPNIKSGVARGIISKSDAGLSQSTDGGF
jgi:hypothetical protein